MKDYDGRNFLGNLLRVEKAESYDFPVIKTSENQKSRSRSRSSETRFVGNKITENTTTAEVGTEYVEILSQKANSVEANAGEATVLNSVEEIGIKASNTGDEISSQNASLQNISEDIEKSNDNPESQQEDQMSNLEKNSSSQNTQQMLVKKPQVNIQLPSLSEIKSFTLTESFLIVKENIELPKLDIALTTKAKKGKKNNYQLPSIDSLDIKPFKKSPDVPKPNPKSRHLEVSLRRSSRLQEKKTEEKLRYSEILGESSEESEEEPELEILKGDDGTKFRVLSGEDYQYVECLTCGKRVQQKSMQAHIKSKVHTFHK